MEGKMVKELKKRTKHLSKYTIEARGSLIRVTAADTRRNIITKVFIGYAENIGLRIYSIDFKTGVLFLYAKQEVKK